MLSERNCLIFPGMKRILFLLSLVWISCNYGAPKLEGELGEIKVQMLHNLPDALDSASISGKPLLVYFSGYACVNARKMEHHYFSDTNIARLMEDFVVVELNTDDRTELNETLCPDSSLRKQFQTAGKFYTSILTQSTGVTAVPVLVFYYPYGSQMPVPPLGYDAQLNSVAFCNFFQRAKEAALKDPSPQAYRLPLHTQTAVCGGTFSGIANDNSPGDTVSAEILSCISLDKKISWRFELKRVSDHEAELLFHASIDKDVRLYAFRQASTDAPKSEINFQEQFNWKHVGDPLEERITTTNDAVFQAPVSFCKGQTTIRQKILLTGKGPYVLEGAMQYFHGGTESITVDNCEFRLLLR